MIDKSVAICRSGIAAVVLLFGLTLAGQDHSKPGIVGEIDEAKAMKWLFGNYEPKTQRSTDGSGYKQVYEFQPAVVSGKRQWYLYIFSNEESNDCHACSGSLSAVVFEKQGQWWVEKSTSELGNIGNSGVPPLCHKIQWGTQSYGLVIDNGYMGYGVLTMYQSLIGVQNGSFERIFTIYSSYNNGGGLKPDPEEDFEAKWSFGPPGPTGAFDLVVKVSKGKRAEDVPDGGVYRYDGKVYRNIKTRKELAKQ